jgi:glycosyltransferase involved in cell wall biosynthesis
MADRISVIVPVYNVAEDLPRCLDSILAQTHPNIEIIAVNDGSPDHSGEILDCYASQNPNIRVIHKENGGVTSARLRGIQVATGEWIGFIDGDDEIEPDMYARLLKNAVEYDADISHCGYQMVFSDGRVNYFHNSGIIREQDSHTAIRDLLEGTLVEPGLCNKLYRRELFQELFQRMDPAIRINEDLLMNYYLFSASEKAVFEDWCPYHYIVRSGSASRAKLNEHKIYDPIRVRQMILEDANPELQQDARRALANTCVYTYCSLVMEKDPAVKQAKGKVREILKNDAQACKLLPRRTGFLAEMIVKAPWLLELVYPVYAKYFQKQKYS